MKILFKVFPLLGIFICLLSGQNLLYGMEEIKPQYNQFRSKWLMDPNHSYYSLLGLKEEATAEKISQAIDNVKFDTLTWATTERAVNQELVNARRLLTEHKDIRKAYDDNYKNGHVQAKNLAITKLAVHQANEINTKEVTDARQFFDTTIENLMSEKEVQYPNYKTTLLYDPAYNKNIVLLHQIMAKKYAQENYLKNAIEIISALQEKLKTLSILTKNTFIFLKDKIYDNELWDKLTEEEKEYLNDINIEDDLVILENKYKEEHIKKPSKPLKPIEDEKLVSSINKFNDSLNGLSTSLK